MKGYQYHNPDNYAVVSDRGQTIPYNEYPVNALST